MKLYNRGFVRPLLVVTLLLCTGVPTASAQQPDVLLVAADHLGQIQDVQQKVQATGEFNTVDIYQARFGTPSLATLQAYDAVLSWGNFCYNDRTAMGDVLADYVDSGGGVVMAVFALSSSGGCLRPGGRFDLENYWAIAPTSHTAGGSHSLGTVYAPSHPVMDGVSAFHGGTHSYRSTSTILVPGAVRIADWTTGEILAAARTIDGTHRRADLGFFPPSSDGISSGWRADTDGDRLMANALLWVAGATGGPPPECTDPATEASWDGSVVRHGGHAFLPIAVPMGASIVEFYNTANLQSLGLYDAAFSDITGDFTISGTGPGDLTYTYTGAPGGEPTSVHARIAQDDPNDNRVTFFVRGEDTCGRTLDIDPTLTLSDEGAEMPDAFALHANYPNPFNPQTTIRFSLGSAEQVRLSVYDLMGREVARLVDGPMGQGAHEVVWNGRDQGGQMVASGTYLYRIEAGQFTATQRMTLLK